MSIREDLAGVGSPPPNLFLKALRENPRILQMTGRPVSREHFIGLLHQAYSEARAEALKGKTQLSEEEKKVFLEADAEAILEWFNNLPEDVKTQLYRLAPARTEFYIWLRTSPEFRLTVAEAYKNIMYQREIEKLLPELDREQFMEEYMKLPAEEQKRIEEELFGGIYMPGGSGEVKLAGKGRFITPLIPVPQEPKPQVEEPVKSLTEKIMEAQVPEILEIPKQFLAGMVASFESLAYLLAPKDPFTRKPDIPIAPPPATVGGAIGEKIINVGGAIAGWVGSLIGVNVELKVEERQTGYLLEKPAYLAGNIAGEILSGMIIGKAIGKLASKLKPPTEAIKVSEYIEYRSGSMVKRAFKGEVLEEPVKARAVLKPEDIIGVRIKAIEYEAEGLRLGVKDIYGEQFTSMLKRSMDIRTTGPEEWLNVKWSLGPIEEYAYTKLLEQPTYQAITRSLTGLKIIFRDEAKIIGEAVTPRLTIGRVEGFLVREAGEGGVKMLSFRGGGAQTSQGLQQMLAQTRIVQQAIAIPKPIETGRIMIGAAAAITLSPNPPRSTAAQAAEATLTVEEEAQVKPPLTSLTLKGGLTQIITPRISLTKPTTTTIMAEKPKLMDLTVIEEALKPKPPIEKSTVIKPVEKPLTELIEQPSTRRTGKSELKPLKIESLLQPQTPIMPRAKAKSQLTIYGEPSEEKRLKRQLKHKDHEEEKRRKRKAWRYFEFINPFPEIRIFGGKRNRRKNLL